MSAKSRAAPGPTGFTGVILSGGMSRRMGQDKAFIEIGGLPIIGRIQTVFSQLFDETIIIANDKAPYLALGSRVYRDLVPERGALGGLYTGLWFASFPYAFCVASDMPFLKESLIAFLMGRLQDEDVLVPRTADGLQPLHAFYSKHCLGAVKQVLDEGKLRILDFYDLVRTKEVGEAEFHDLDPDRESFINVNTPGELERIRRRMPQG